MQEFVENEAVEGLGGNDNVSNEDLNNDTGSLESAGDTAGQELVEDLKIPEDLEQPIKDFINGDVFKDNFDAKKAFFDKFINFDKGYKKKFTDLDLERQAFNKEKESFDDVRNLSQGYKSLEESCRGINSDIYNREIAKLGGANQYFQSLHTVNSMLESDPLGTINNICSTYGITPQMLMDGANSPEYINRQNTISQNQLMEQKIEQAKQEWQQQLENEKIDNLVNQFTSSVDGEGNQKYPHFDSVRNNMALMIEQSGIVSPTIDDLDKAYQNACYADPTLRAELIKSEIASQAKANMQNNDVMKAEMVAGVKTKAKPITKQKRSWRDVANQLVDGIPD